MLLTKDLAIQIRSSAIQIRSSVEQQVQLMENICSVLETNEKLLQDIASALWGEGPDTPWTPDTFDSIVQAFELHRPDLTPLSPDHA